MAAALGVTVCANLPVFLTAALVPRIQHDIALPAGVLGISVGVFFGAGSFGSHVLGRLVERIGWPRGLQLAAVMAFASAAGIALVVDSVPTLLVALIVAGLSNAMGQPAANLALARAVRDGRQGTMFGIKQAALPMASLLAGAALPAFAITLGWRPAFAVAGVAAIAIAFSVPRDRSERSPDSRKEEPVVRSTSQKAWLLSAGGGLASASAVVLAGFLVASVVHGGMNESHAGQLLAVGSGVGVAMRVLTGWWADRKGSGSQLKTVSTLLAVGAVGHGLLALQTNWASIPGGVIGFGAGWGWAGLFHYSVVQEFEGSPAAGTGTALTGAYLGAMIGPAAFGFIADAASYRMAWFASALTALAGAALLRISARVPPEAVTTE